MDKEMENVGLDYNTQRGKLRMPEYGRNVQKMIEYVKSLPEKEKRDEQARAVIKVMETLNTQVHQQENWEQKLWDHLHAISGFDIDVDSPYPAPEPEHLSARPMMIPVKRKPLKATHYGRNIESIIDLIAEQPDGDVKTAMIRSLADGAMMITATALITSPVMKGRSPAASAALAGSPAARASQGTPAA